ncbi:hypothetical protein CROQUDRAFT_93109 [Cronartium quercuum f. sp. fusiforme G11]|uniref:Uncharacterized protein n=1 Tax=Cronartium quercuum f. sp. fusiforme G11 TaxID=708437 RepID=A0A9P6TCX4_9BASI|nr:hypothetical protein CROQUDRAFT_93109 [Cronartium quercuum f. sp. fusiforme G11]
MGRRAAHRRLSAHDQIRALARERDKRDPVPSSRQRQAPQENTLIDRLRRPVRIGSSKPSLAIIVSPKFIHSHNTQVQKSSEPHSAVSIEGPSRAKSGEVVVLGEMTFLGHTSGLTTRTHPKPCIRVDWWVVKCIARLLQSLTAIGTSNPSTECQVT